MASLTSTLRSESKAAWLRRWLLFIVLFCATLVLEGWLNDPGSGISYVIFCVGLIIGAMHISHARQWPGLLLTAAVIHCFWLFVSEPSLGAGNIVIYSIGIVALAAFCGSTPSWLLPGDRREMRPNEIFVGCLITTLVAGYGFVFLYRLTNPELTSGTLQDVVACLSFLLGVAAVAPPVVVFGLAYGRPQRYSARRVATIVAAAVIFVITSGLVVQERPSWLYQLLAPFEQLWVWVMIFAGIALALRASAVTSTTVALIATTVCVYSLQHAVVDSTNLTTAYLQEVAEAQITALGVLVIVLSFAALVSGRRKDGQLRAIREGIAKDILKANQPGGGVDISSMKDGLTLALGVAAEYCGADESRLYLTNPARDQFSMTYCWRQEGADGSVDDTPASFGESEAPDIIDRTQRGDTTLIRVTGDERSELEEEALSAFGLPADVAILCQPLSSENGIFGLAVMINYEGAPISRRDAKPLLQSIGDFYAGFRARELTRKSLREYEQRLRHLATRFAHAEESVRRRTAVELHDGLIQRLAVARMKLGELRTRRNSAPDIAHEITQIVDEALGESRAIIHSLSPSVLYELGLVPGLQSLCEELCKENHFDIEIREHGHRSNLSEAIRVCIYQVVRELLTNSIKHSGGQKIWIDLFWEQATLNAAVVSDDGKRANWWIASDNQHENASLGLLSASERLRPFGFNIKFEQRRGGGTRAIVYWATA